MRCAPLALNHRSSDGCSQRFKYQGRVGRITSPNPGLPQSRVLSVVLNSLALLGSLYIESQRLHYCQLEGDQVISATLPSHFNARDEDYDRNRTARSRITLIDNIKDRSRATKDNRRRDFR